MMFPVVIVTGGAVSAVHRAPVMFIGPGDVQHFPEVWHCWSAEDWESLCPGWTLLPLIDVPPTTPGKRAVRRPMDAWTVGADAVTVTYDLIDLTPEEVERECADALVQRIAEVKAEAGRRILTIAPEWMQRNLTARAAELALLYPGTKGVDLPEPERFEYLAGQAVWGSIRAIRIASNEIEAALSAAASADGASAADVLAVDASAGWPD